MELEKRSYWLFVVENVEIWEGIGRKICGLNVWQRKVLCVFFDQRDPVIGTEASDNSRKHRRKGYE
jgi:hypothetical protein